MNQGNKLGIGGGFGFLIAVGLITVIIAIACLPQNYANADQIYAEVELFRNTFAMRENLVNSQISVEIEELKRQEKTRDLEQRYALAIRQQELETSRTRKAAWMQLETNLVSELAYMVGDLVTSSKLVILIVLFSSCFAVTIFIYSRVFFSLVSKFTPIWQAVDDGGDDGGGGLRRRPDAHRAHQNGHERKEIRYEDLPEAG